MDRVFLDANVLFSAAYTPDSRLLTLWSLKGVRLVTSLLAVEEARRNLEVHSPGRLANLDKLVSRVAVASANVAAPLPDDIDLPDKDIPILAAAIALGATHLLTGDTRHFGSLYGRTIAGVLIQTPAQYLRVKTP